MKGFPLLSTLGIVLAFALAWWPLRHALTGDGSPPGAAVGAAAASPAPDPSPPADRSEPVRLRVFATAPVTRLRLEHLGQVIVDLPEGFSGEMTRSLETLEIPREGIEWWVEASLAVPGGDFPRSALGIEVTSPDGETRLVTRWCEADGEIADTAPFVWEEAP